jgi:Cu2+-exporting ATPase
VIFDKTGTLTKGAVSLLGCTATGTLPQRDCLAIAGALEAASEHPIAHAFCATLAAAPPATDVQVVSGAGIEGTVDARRYRIGTAAFVADPAFRRAAPRPRPQDGPQDGSQRDDGAVVLGNSTGELARFWLGDAPRADSASAVAALQDLGLQTDILSGDAFSAVQGMAEHCGIRNFAARQSPQGKLAHVRKLTAQGEFVAMVGDGINDAPVLGGCGVSIAMGRGSALTLASADVILVGDSLQAFPAAISLARRAKGIIRQNLLWAAGYNLTAMPLAALGWVPPWLAAIGMSLSSIIVVLNSLRLMRGDAPSCEPPKARTVLPAQPLPDSLLGSPLS